MSAPILSVRALRKSFGGTEIIRGLDLDILPGERHAIIGPNGAGKSTLFHLMTGNLTPSSGQVIFEGTPLEGRSAQEVNRMGVARSFQITNIFPKLTVFENVRIAVMRKLGLQYVLWRLIDRNTELRDRTERLLQQVRLHTRTASVAGELSYSEQRSLEIAMALASEPRLLLLDEPMAGMSHEETDYTVELIREVTQGRTLMLVEHDMDVVFSISDRVSVLVYGEVIATGTPREIRDNPKVREAYLGEEIPA